MKIDSTVYSTSFNPKKFIILPDKINYHIDLVLYERETQQAIAVLDTKYKTPEKPSNADLNQIVHYALLKHTQRAILIYPESLPHPVDETNKNIRVQTIPFVLNGAIATAGEQFLTCLFPENEKT